MAKKFKICLLGSFAVGKTSLVHRFVQNAYDDKYITTVGVVVEKKMVKVGNTDVMLVLWDIQGEDDFQKIKPFYLRGMSGYILVSDGTRVKTLKDAMDIQNRVDQDFGKFPCIYLLNKADLHPSWEVQKNDVAPLIAKKIPVLNSSAKTGEGVEKAFTYLATKLLKG